VREVEREVQEKRVKEVVHQVVEAGTPDTFTASPSPHSPGFAVSMERRKRMTALTASSTDLSHIQREMQEVS